MPNCGSRSGFASGLIGAQIVARIVAGAGCGCGTGCQLVEQGARLLAFAAERGIETAHLQGPLHCAGLLKLGGAATEL